VLWPQNLGVGAIATANYTFNHYRHLSPNTHKYMLESINFTNYLTKINK